MRRVGRERVYGHHDIQRLALSRVRELFQEAAQAFSTHPERSHRYMAIARNLAMKARLKMPVGLKRRMCKRCFHYLVPGANCKVRVKNKMRVVQCFHCGCMMRLSLASAASASAKESPGKER